MLTLQVFHKSTTSTVCCLRATRRGNRLSTFQTFEVKIVRHGHTKTNVTVTVPARSNVGYGRVFCKAFGTSEGMPGLFERCGVRKGSNEVLFITRTKQVKKLTVY